MLLGLFGPLLVGPGNSHGQLTWRFTEVTGRVGLSSRHGYRAAPLLTPMQRVAGGVAAGDFDGDGWIDLYVEAGDIGPNFLFRNRGNGRFEEVAAAAGVALPEHAGSGPLFFDYDGDGGVDLFVGGFGGSRSMLFRNRNDGTFEDVTAAAGLSDLADTVSATAGDHDGDGWLDLFLSHWQVRGGGCHLWRNAGGERFVCVDEDAGLSAIIPSLPASNTFAANFADIDDNGTLDLLLASDFGTSQVLENRGDGTFADVTPLAISDENGMGGAVGDYDGDGDLDWFVSSIWDGDGVTEGAWGATGNRMYRNRGDGTFEDATGEAGVREGDWGWAASFADLNHDGWLDLVHVNGWPQGSAQFRNTRTRLFLGHADGVFAERGAELGLDDRGNGRGLVCFDYDGDGDLDIFTAHNSDTMRLWRNDGGVALGAHVSVELRGAAPNWQGIGARIYVTAGGRTQMQEVRAGSNYASQNPVRAHFGLGTAGRIERVRVVWPDGTETMREDLPVNQHVVVELATPRASAGGCSG